MTKCEEGAGGTVEQGWSDEAEYISEDVLAGSHLARHHCSGEQLVQLNQFVGRGVKLERNAVQRVPRFHLEQKNKKTEETGITRAALFTKKLQMKDFKAEARFQWTLRNRHKPLEWN